MKKHTPGRGYGATTVITALVPGVDLRQITGSYLLKAGDTARLPYDVRQALRNFRQKTALARLETNKAIRVDVITDTKPQPEPAASESSVEPQKPTSSCSQEPEGAKPEPEMPGPQHRPVITRADVMPIHVEAILQAMERATPELAKAAYDELSPALRADVTPWLKKTNVSLFAFVTAQPEAAPTVSADVEAMFMAATKPPAEDAAKPTNVELAVEELSSVFGMTPTVVKAVMALEKVNADTLAKAGVRRDNIYTILDIMSKYWPDKLEA